MSDNLYDAVVPYEWFICRAYKCIGQWKYGAHYRFMWNLVLTERSGGRDRTIAALPKYDKQLEKVKAYMNEALDKFLKEKLTADEKSKLHELKEQLVAAYSTAELMRIVEEGLEVTQRFKES